MTLLSGINHAALLTRDLARTVEFYTEGFGAEVVFEEDGPELRHAILRIGEHTMLHPVQVPAAGGAGAHIAQPGSARRLTGRYGRVIRGSQSGSMQNGAFQSLVR